MGRPLNKRFFGTTASGGDESNEQNLNVSVKVGANTATDLGIVLSQRSETSFKVNDNPAGTGNSGICALVNKSTPALAANEMSLQGYVAGQGAVYIRKVMNRRMIDFNDNSYTWSIDDDSTSNILVLVAV